NKASIRIEAIKNMVKTGKENAAILVNGQRSKIVVRNYAGQLLVIELDHRYRIDDIQIPKESRKPRSQAIKFPVQAHVDIHKINTIEKPRDGLRSRIES